MMAQNGADSMAHAPNTASVASTLIRAVGVEGTDDALRRMIAGPHPIMVRPNSTKKGLKSDGMMPT